MSEYTDMRQRHSEETSALPIYWAFSNERFEEILKEMGLTRANTDQLRRTPGGGFCKASDAQHILDTLRRHQQELDGAIEADTTGEGFIREMFLYELKNHEYGYTLETEDAIRACGLTPEAVEADQRLKRGLELATRQIREAEGFSW